MKGKDHKDLRKFRDKDFEYVSFSIREGHINPEEVIRRNYKDMTKELKTEIWNEFYGFFLPLSSKIQTSILQKTWRGIFKEPIDDFYELLQIYFGNLIEFLTEEVKERFFRLEWNRIYDFLELIARETPSEYSKHFCERINKVLKENFSPYRFLECDNVLLIVPIISDMELEALERAINKTKKKFIPVHEHLKKSIQHLSNRENPDYENAVKEAVSALESLANLILGERGETLTSLRQQLSSQLNLPRFVELQIKELYNWASDTPARHGTGDKPGLIGQEEAQLVVVQTSALVNYLISKMTDETEVKDDKS